MFAYFLGGPLDLTKRATKAEHSTWLVPVAKRASPLLAPPVDGELPVPIDKHEYRLMFREDDLLIYIYQGIRQ